MNVLNEHEIRWTRWLFVNHSHDSWDVHITSVVQEHSFVWLYCGALKQSRYYSVLVWKHFGHHNRRFQRVTVHRGVFSSNASHISHALCSSPIVTQFASCVYLWGSGWWLVDLYLFFLLPLDSFLLFAKTYITVTVLKQLIIANAHVGVLG